MSYHVNSTRFQGKTDRCPLLGRSTRLPTTSVHCIKQTAVARYGRIATDMAIIITMSRPWTTYGFRVAKLLLQASK